MRLPWLFLGLVFLVACHPYATGVQATYYKEALAEQTVNQRAESIIAPYREQLTEEMAEILETVPYSLEKKQPESTLGGWFSDILLDGAQKMHNLEADFVVQNYGGIRLSSVPKGAISVGKIYELMPFDNSLVLLKLSGSDVQTFVDHFMSLGGWPVSKGIQIRSDGYKNEIIIHNEPLQLNSTYQVLVSDYIANGGDRCAFLKDKPRDNFNILIRELAINYLKKADNTILEKEKYKNRITIDQ